jgi:hypothetical protein
MGQTCGGETVRSRQGCNPLHLSWLYSPPAMTLLHRIVSRTTAAQYTSSAWSVNSGSRSLPTTLSSSACALGKISGQAVRVKMKMEIASAVYDKGLGVQSTTGSSGTEGNSLTVSEPAPYMAPAKKVASSSERPYSPWSSRMYFAKQCWSLPCLMFSLTPKKCERNSSRVSLKMASASRFQGARARGRWLRKWSESTVRDSSGCELCERQMTR